MVRGNWGTAIWDLRALHEFGFLCCPDGDIQIPATYHSMRNFSFAGLTILDVVAQESRQNSLPQLRRFNLTLIYSYFYPCLASNFIYHFFPERISSIKVRPNLI